MTRPTNTAIRASGLSKRFGNVQAVSGIDLDLPAGTALGLLGPNGAGKSTTLSMLMGLIPPEDGIATIFGHPAGSQAARALTGATPQATGFPDQLTPREILDYTAARYDQPAQTADLITRFGLDHLSTRRTAGFSGGEMRRLALALAFVGNPDLVFLDEPTSGLDTAAQEGFRNIARDYVAQGGTLVLTSHHWDEIEAICGTIALIDAGTILLQGRIDDIRARTKVNRLSFELPADIAPPDWLSASHDGQRWHVETGQSDQTLRRMVDQTLPFSNLTLEPLKLKDLIDRLRHEETNT